MSSVDWKVVKNRLIDFMKSPELFFVFVENLASLPKQVDF